jgi:hypothetical protein
MTIICSPLGYLVSYLLLWLFFHLDSGYFTQVNVQFVYEVRGENLSKMYVNVINRRY